jgi:hypothetical protein
LKMENWAVRLGRWRATIEGFAGAGRFVVRRDARRPPVSRRPISTGAKSGGAEKCPDSR